MRGTVTSIAFLVALLGWQDASFAQKKGRPRCRVRVRSTPPGAIVHLDKIGLEPLGVTPIRLVRVPCGYHEFVFVLEGYRMEKVGVNVSRRRIARVKSELVQQAQIIVSADGESAVSADVYIDGRKSGEVPHSVWVDPGRHHVEVKQPGYATLSQWVRLKSGQILTVPAVLRKESSPTGTLFVTADVFGAPIYVDGVERGKTPLSLDLPAGRVLVEIRADNLPPWRKTVDIKARDKVIVEAAIRPETGPSGTALVLSNVPNTLVWIDGTETGTAPVTAERLAVGTHIVEGKSDGYEPAQTTVRVNANEQTVVKLEMKPVQASYGRISVRATVPGAVVYIDGGEQGPAPVELDQVALGPHAVIVRAPGYADFESVCEVKRNQMCKVMARQTPLARIRVVSQTPGARLFIDDQEMGPLPFEGTVTADEHSLRVEAPNYITSQQRVLLELSAEVREFTFTLSSAGTSPQDIAKKRQSARERRLAAFADASNVSGIPPGPGKNAVDLSVGYPFMFEARGMVGIAEHFAIGVAGRVLERDVSLGITELALRGHTGFRVVDALSLGAQLEVWGGTNFNTINSFGGRLTGIGTLHFGKSAQFSLSFGGELSYDVWDNVPNISLDGSEDGSQTIGRFWTGGTFLIWLKPKLALWAGFDYRTAGDARLLFREAYFGALNRDPKTYTRVGVTVRF